MKYTCIHQLRAEYAVVRLCQVLQVSVSGYYRWRKRQPSVREQANAKLLDKIRIVHGEHRGIYGSPRIHAELQAQGERCSRKRVERLMRLDGLAGKCKRRRRICTTDTKHQLPVAPNLLNQDFTVDTPNAKWVSDITYIPTAQGWLYLAAVLDLFSRRIVGWAMDTTMTTQLVERALKAAVQTRQPQPGLLHHSDRGSQYASLSYRTLLRSHKIQVSMSRTGNCYDNAAMESFFATLKVECVHDQRYVSFAEAKQDLFRYIEGFYNQRRRHSALDYLCPLEFERRHAQVLN
jgi:transposase InsO family protein